MTVQARAEWDWQTLGFKVCLLDRQQDGSAFVRCWPLAPHRLHTTPMEPFNEPEGLEGLDAWLRVNEAEARALYDALATVFGHSSDDSSALREHLKVERQRVDTLTQALIYNVQALTKGQQ